MIALGFAGKTESRWCVIPPGARNNLHRQKPTYTTVVSSVTAINQKFFLPKSLSPELLSSIATLLPRNFCGPLSVEMAEARSSNAPRRLMVYRYQGLSLTVCEPAVESVCQTKHFFNDTRKIPPQWYNRTDYEILPCYDSRNRFRAFSTPQKRGLKASNNRTAS